MQRIRALALSRRSLGGGLLAGLVALGQVGHWDWQAAAARETPLAQRDRPPVRLIRPPVRCPATLDALVPLLLRDIPSYANRVIQRSRRPERSIPPTTYILIAGRPEFEPLPILNREYQPSVPQEQPLQVFFTTLERQYVRQVPQRVQVFHWLFLTHSTQGWQMAFLFSQIQAGDDQPITPPEDTTQGIVGEATRLWLRDCQTGNIVL